MEYSRRNFLEAAGSSAAALTTVCVGDVGGGTAKAEAQAQTAGAQAVALTVAAPLKYNAEKIGMAKGLLASALEKLSA